MLVLSQHFERNYAAQLLATSAEGVGYLLKDRVAQVEEFLEALRKGTPMRPSRRNCTSR